MYKKKVAVLGPEMSNSYTTALSYYGSEDIFLADTIGDVFRCVDEGTVEKGIVPVKNSIGGTVPETSEALSKYKVIEEKIFDVPIHHCLAAQADTFIKIASHPQALAQCSKYLKTFGANIHTEQTTSTSQAMKLASENSEYAAIGNELAAAHYGLIILAKHIENDIHNTSTFLLFHVHN
jgi:prephenate dehydratase